MSPGLKHIVKPGTQYAPPATATVPGESSLIRENQRCVEQQAVDVAVDAVVIVRLLYFVKLLLTLLSAVVYPT